MNTAVHRLATRSANTIGRTLTAHSNIADLPVYTNNAKRDNFFAHVLYWDTKYGGDAPHIRALRDAIDLGDFGIANKL